MTDKALEDIKSYCKAFMWGIWVVFVAWSVRDYLFYKENSFVFSDGLDFVKKQILPDFLIAVVVFVTCITVLCCINWRLKKRQEKASKTEQN